MFEMGSRLFACSVGLLFSIAVGCSDPTPSKPQGGSESHFLEACTSGSACGDGLTCIAAVCTRSCDEASDCAALGASAQCVAPASGAETAQFCDVLCERDADCAALSTAMCAEGRCRGERAPTNDTDASTSDARTPMEPDNDGAIPDSGALDSGQPIAPPQIVDPMPSSKRYACVTYELAVKGRRDECLRADLTYDPPIIALGDMCPGTQFADGTTATIESLIACADEWRDFPCEAVGIGLEPPCASRGTRVAGERCRFGAQCEAGSCLGEVGGFPLCATCSDPVPALGDCSGDNTANCEAGTRCVDDVCVAYDLPARALGERCELDAQCPLPHLCLAAGDAPARCAERPSEGEPCERSTQLHYASCAAGTLCSERMLCEAPAELGQPCLVELEPGVFSERCEPGAFCDDSGMCAALPVEGEACTQEVLKRCAEGFGCFDGVCRPSGGPGEPCQVAYHDPEQESCRPGLSCTCTDESCAPPGICLQVLPEGAACTGANTLCAKRTQCIDGVCVADDTITAAENECAP